MSQYNACNMCAHGRDNGGSVYCSVKEDYLSKLTDTSECPHYDDKDEEDYDD